MPNLAVQSRRTGCPVLPLLRSGAVPWLYRLTPPASWSPGLHCTAYVTGPTVRVWARLSPWSSLGVPNAARRSVGVTLLADAVRVEMRCLLEQIELLEEQRAQVDEELEALMA